MTLLKQLKAAIPSLNQEQISAIQATDGPVLIIAGPGTGKTLTLVARTFHILLSDKAKPEEIVLTTFTEKAAFELRDRLSQLAKKLNYKGQIHLLNISTIHSLCDKFINKFLSFTPLRKGYQVLDELTQAFFLYENFDKIITTKNKKYLGKWKTKWSTIEEFIPYVNKLTEELIETKRLENSRNEFLCNLATCYKKYRETLFEKNRIDFAHLQKIFLDLLNNKDLYPKIKQNIKYIMVDEYQDTNYIQEQILLTLAKPENNICVVGDEDQSLYRFRGATVRNILEFPKHSNSCTQIKLTINYRSHPTIIERYNKFITSIDWGKFRFNKKMVPDPNAKFPNYPALFCIWSKNDEPQRLVQLIKFLKENNVIQDWSDIAILLKSVKPEHSKHYIQALMDNNIPYFAPRAKTYFENEEIKFLLACYSIIFGFYNEHLKDYAHKNYIEEAFKLLYEKINPSLKGYLQRRAYQIENLKEDSLDLTVLDYFYPIACLRAILFNSKR